MLRDVMSATQAYPVTGGDYGWYYFLKRHGGIPYTSFARECKKLHIAVGEILQSLGAAPARLWGGFVDHGRVVDAEFLQEAVDVYTSTARNRVGLVDLEDLAGRFVDDEDQPTDEYSWA